MEMDDENFIDYQKMNFSPFATQFASTIPANAVNQFAAAKFAQNLSTANGQVLGLVSGADGEVHYLNAAAATTAPSQIPQQALITLPITMPGAKPGDAQQTVQIQVVNPNPIQQLQQNQQAQQQMQAAPKFQMGQMQIPIQNFQQGTTVLTVAYAPQDGDLIHNHGLPEGMTVVAALQPQDLQLLAQAQAAFNSQQQQQHQQQNSGDNSDKETLKTIKQEPPDQPQQNSMEQTQEQQQQQQSQIQWNNPMVAAAQATDITQYLSRIPNQDQLNQFLKFNVDTIKRESQVQNSPLNGLVINYDYAQLMEQQQQQQQQIHQQSAETQTPDSNNNEESNPKGAGKGSEGVGGGDEEGSGGGAEGKGKKKRRYKKKPPKPKRPKPGQVHIATAIDGTLLFCCPECQRAYPEKENLEQHLSTHKIERRFICDICGAGLKRKEHLERHKLGHNPDRPYVCGVCLKGFKRKEHLNLHVVIHSGEKTEICGECGKGFYRKDHLRKHAKSHALKRQKELNAQVAALSGNSTKSGSGKGEGSKKSKKQQQQQASTNGQAMSIPFFEIPISSISSTGENTTTTVTASISKEHTMQGIPSTTQIIHIPTGDNTTLPVQIQLPQLLPISMDHSSSTTSTAAATAS